MPVWLIVLLFSIAAVTLFVVGMSLTLIVKGHHIDGEISTNRHMRSRGITCAVADAHKDTTTGDCTDSLCTSPNGTTPNCPSCRKGND